MDQRERAVVRALAAGEPGEWLDGRAIHDRTELPVLEIGVIVVPLAHAGVVKVSQFGPPFRYCLTAAARRRCRRLVWGRRALIVALALAAMAVVLRIAAEAL